MRWFLAVAAAMVATAAPSAQPARVERPVEAFAELPFMESPQLSPSGSKIAAKLAVNGTQRLIIHSLDGAQPVLIGLGEIDLNWWRWVNDEWLVIGIGGTDLVEGDTWYIRRAMGVHATDGRVQPLATREAAQGADDVLWIADDGSPRILMAMQKSIYSSDPEFWPQVYEIDVSNGKARQVVGPRENVMDWYADAAGVVRMGIGVNPATRRAHLLYRSSNKEPFKSVDQAEGRKDEQLTIPAMFLADPTKALVYDDSSGFNSLYELELPTLKLGKKVFGVEGYDLGPLISDAKGSTLAGIRYVDDRSRVHWLDPTLAAVQADLDKAVGDRTATIVSLSRDRTKMVVAVGSPSQAGAYYYYDTAFGTMRQIAYVNSMFKGTRLGPVKTIRYKARDGLEIPAILTLPPGRDPKALPLIVMPHGGPAVRDAEGWDWWAQFLADRGYAVVQPNYRGSTGFGAAFLEKGNGEWGLKMQDDLNDVVAHLAKEGIADPARVCVVGASYGGYAALRAAQRDGAKYRCAISYAGVSDLSHLARFDSNSLYGRSAKAYLRNKAPDFQSVSPVRFAEQFATPVLLVHGKKDLRVPAAQSREMAEKLRKAGKPVEYIEQPQGDHYFSRQEDRLQFLKVMEAFLDKHNPA